MAVPQLALLAQTTADFTDFATATVTITAPASVGDVVLVEVFHPSGGAPSDSQGNTYVEVAAGTDVKVYQALLTTALSSGVDTITVSNTWHWRAFRVRDFDAISVIGETDSISGSVNFPDNTIGTVRTAGPAVLDNSVNGYVSSNLIVRGVGGLSDLASPVWARSIVPTALSSSAGNRPGHSTGDTEDYRAYFGEGASYDGGAQEWAVTLTMTSGGGFGFLSEDINYTLLIYQILGTGTITPPTPPDAEAEGVDIAETANGWLFVAYHETLDPEDLHVARSTDAGETWDIGEPIATDAAEFATPTLLAVPQDADEDTLWCYYHTSAPALKILRSEDLGDTWELFATHPGYRHARAVWLGGGLMLFVLMNGDLLELMTSDDFGLTDPELVSTVGEHPAQLACLRQDRFGRTHLIYADEDGKLWHRSSSAPEVAGTWTADVEVTPLPPPMTFPAYAVGVTCGFLFCWDEAQPVASLLTETYDEESSAGGTPDPTPALIPMYTGLIFNRYQDVLLACKDTEATGPVYVYSSPDEGESWTALNGGSGF
jgi:hypothetical protein